MFWGNAFWFSLRIDVLALGSFHCIRASKPPFVVFWLMLIRVFPFSLLSADNLLSPSFTVPQYYPTYSPKVLGSSSRLSRVQQKLEAEATPTPDFSSTLQIFLTSNHRFISLTGRNGICDCSTRVEHVMAWTYAQVDEGPGLLLGWLNMSSF